MKIIELYSYILKRNEREHNFKVSIENMYKKNAFFSSLIFRALLWVFFLFFLPKGKIKYFFYGTKFKSLIKSFPKDEVCIIGGPKQIGFILENGISLISCICLWIPLYNGFKSERFFKYIFKNALIFEKKIKKYTDSSGVFIVDNDSMPMQRLCINIFRQLGFKCICIQDGLFQSKSPEYAVHGHYADKFICYDVCQRNILVDKGISIDKIIVGGFYANPYRPKRKLSDCGVRNICFLGQPWFRYDDNIYNSYLENYNKICQVLNESNIILHYKPHPWEVNASYLSDLKNIFFGSLDQAFEEFDVFISHTSTALLEATRAGRVAIQILDDVFQSDDFSTMGYAYKIVIDSDIAVNLHLLISSEPLEVKQEKIKLADVIVNEC